MSSWVGGGTCRAFLTTRPARCNWPSPSGTLTAAYSVERRANPIQPGAGPCAREHRQHRQHHCWYHGTRTSTNVGSGTSGTLGTGIITMNSAGTLIYDGATATSAKPLTLAGNSSIIVPNAGVKCDCGRRNRSRAALQVQGTGSRGQSGYEHVDVARQQDLHRHHLCEQKWAP